MARDGAAYLIKWNYSYAGTFNYTFPTRMENVSFLIVAGGGGAGSGLYGGGAGAGGLRTNINATFTGTKAITIGQGGRGGPDNNVQSGYNGQNTNITSDAGVIFTFGGGKGGGFNSPCGVDGGGNGGSGGGSSRGCVAGSTTDSLQGNNGGSGFSQRGGGGGKNSAGLNDGFYFDSYGSNGGLGYLGNITGESILYAWGGRGGNISYPGHPYDLVEYSTRGTGSGGNSSVSNMWRGGNGSPGAAIIRYYLPSGYTQPNSIFAGANTQFNDSSYESPNVWNWSINITPTTVVWYNISGFPAPDSRNITYAFPSVGWYLVNLTTYNTTTLTAPYTVSTWTEAKQAFFANFTISPAIKTTGTTVQFNDTTTTNVSAVRPSLWNWSINQSLSSVIWYNVTPSNQNITYVLPSTGDFMVNLTIGNSSEYSSWTNVTSKLLYSNVTLAVDFNATPLYSKPNRSISFVDMSVGGGLYNWTWNFGDGVNLTYPQPVPPPNTSYNRNPTKSYQLVGNYNVNLTVKGADGQTNLTKNAYIRINLNNTLTLTFKDADTFLPITVPMGVSITSGGAPYTTGMSDPATGIAWFELPNAAYSVTIPSNSEYEGAVYSVTMASTDQAADVILTPTSSTSTNLNIKQTQAIRFMCRDWKGVPIVDMNVTAVGVQSTLGAVDWFFSLFGIDLDTAPILNTTMWGNTGTDGSIVFLMVPTEKYNLTYVCTTRSIHETRYYYIKQEEYEEIFWTSEPVYSSEAISYQLVNLTNGSYMDLGANWTDPALSTTYFHFFVEDVNGNTIYSITPAPPLGTANVS